MKRRLLFIVALIFITSVQSQQRIIGGDDTTITENSWQVSIRGTNNHHNPVARNNHFCGGSILAPNWILTAAHCVTNNIGGVLNPNEISIAAGITLREDNITGQYRNVVQIIN